MRDARHGLAGLAALGTRSARERTHLRFADALLRQRMQHTVLGRGEQARTPVTEFIGVGAGGDGRQCACDRVSTSARALREQQHPGALPSGLVQMRDVGGK